MERPDHELLSAETRATIAAAIDALPDSQPVVIALRDVEAWRAPDVCEALEITEPNQRVLLHGARTKVRHAVDAYRWSREAAGAR